MLTHRVRHVTESVFLKLAGGDPIKADALQVKTGQAYSGLIRIAFLPLVLAVVYLVGHQPADINAALAADQKTAIEGYAIRYLDVFLKDPSNAAALRAFYDGDVPASPIPPGGRTTGVSSALPGKVIGGFQSWSVVVDTQVPKATNSTSTFYLPLQVEISIDRLGLFRAFTLPHARTDRPEGKPVQLATTITVSDDRPLYKTVNGFLGAMLLGQGEIQPYIASGANLRAADPPRFVTLSIEQVQASSEEAVGQEVPAKADNVEVTVRALAQTSAGVIFPMDYPLVMSVAAGHWQVNSINDAPTFVPPDDTGIGVPSSSPTTTTTRTRSPLAKEGS
ncbi:Uncharacterised protein [Mycobacteroides abscessus subsp. abscessus]|nr:Uncharacterised protein [Mycobacteroides abscessus subsp. abscessus]SLH38927.1 Uncharacterised protein [Mycobacteroides abscessus subsp. abscessus]